MKTCVSNLKSNAEKWSTYEETENDKRVYLKPGEQPKDMEQIKEE